MTRFQKKFADYLKQNGLRHSDSRMLIATVLAESDGHLSIKDLYGEVRARNEGIGMATVYRTVNLLKAAGLVEEVHFGDGATRFEPVLSDTRHDHLVCECCGRQFEVREPQIMRIFERFAEESGFTVTARRVCLYGICPDCKRAKEREALPDRSHMPLASAVACNAVPY